MKTNYLKICLVLLSFSLVLFQSSCKKEDSLKFNELSIYIPSGSIAFNIFGSDSVVILEGGTTKNEWIAFPVYITRPVSKDIEISAKIDPSLVRVYDSINKLVNPSPVLNPEAVELANNGNVVIKSGAISSLDSIRVLIKNPALLETGIRDHIIPVVIDFATDNVPISSSRKIMFVKLFGKIISAGITSTVNSMLIKDSIAKNGNDLGGNTTFYFKGTLIDQVSGDQTIQVEPNNGLIENYNSLYKTNCLAFPGNTYQLLKNAVQVPAGTINSKDSITINLDNYNKLEIGKEYLLPLQIKSISGSPQLPAISNQKITYLYLKVYSSNIDPRNAGLTGAAMNRTLWTVSASSQYSVNVPPRVLDGSSSTYWSTTNTLLPANIDLNMGTVRTVKGFNLTPPSTSSYRFMTMEVLSSQDGNSWNQEGTFNLATNTSTVRTLKFVTPVTAQYFRFNVTRGSGTTYTGIAEINGVE